MKRISVLIALLFFIINSGIGQIVKFEKVYGGNGYDYGYSVIQTYDKGYVVTGSTTSFGSGNSDVYIIRLDSMGVFKWQRTIGGINIDQAYSVQQTSDSGLVIAGYTNGSGAGGYDAYLVKTDSNGIVQWSKTYGGADWDFAYSAVQTADGGYILCGGTYSYGKGNEDMYLLKTNSTGDTTWTKTYGGLYEDEAKSVIQTTDGGYILTGYTKSLGDSLGDLYTVKTDSNGDTLWTKRLGAAGKDIANQIIQTTDGGYMIAGASKDPAGNYNDALLVKTDSFGDTLFTRRFGSPNDASANSIYQTTDGGYIWVGKLLLGTHYTIYFFKVDGGGYYSFVHTFGALSADNDGMSVKQTTDGGYVVAAITNGFNNGLEDVYVFKTDGSGVSSGTIINTTGIEESYISKNDQNQLLVYPNPSNTGYAEILLRDNVNNKDDVVLNVFNSIGEVVYSETYKNNFISTNSTIRLNTSKIKTGIYFIQLSYKDKKYSAKLSIENN